MKYRLIYIAALVLMSSTFANISQTAYAQKEVFTDAETLAGQWKLMPVLASDTAAGKVPVIQFNIANHSFLGNTGCNSMSGKFTLNGNMLSFGEQEITTKLACQGYNEDAFVASLIKVNHYKIENGVLMLMVDQTVLSKWVRKEPLNAQKAI
jgi:heat shock protein HslJ